jgi:solute carrier family 5 (sodium/myo-inositol cotransporter), member 3
MADFHWVDMMVVIMYFVAVIIVGLIASCRAKKNTAQGFFLAGRSMPFYIVGCSLFASNIGSDDFIGLAGSGAASGIGVGAWEFNAIVVLQILGFLFIPVYFASQLYTVPEYLEKRFGGERLRSYLAILSILLYILTKCSVNLFGGSLMIQQAFGGKIFLNTLILIAIVAVVTATGGLTAVIVLDFVQTIFILSGATALMIVGFVRLGGFNGLWREYPLARPNVTVPNTTCHEPHEHWNKMLASAHDDYMPWAGFVFGQMPGQIWYWCTDQVIVQKALAAKKLSHAQAGTLVAGLIKILPFFLIVLPGMMSRVILPDKVACVDPDMCYWYCESRTGCSNVAYPALVLELMPVGAKGIMIAVMLGAMMCELDSVFNSSSTLFTMDIYKRIRRNASTRELLLVSKLFIIVMVAVAIAWIPVVMNAQGGQMFIYIQEVTVYLSPPIAAAFLLGVLWPRCNEKGAFWGLMFGFAAGMTRLVLMIVYRGPEHCGDEDTRPSFISNGHFMYFALLLFWATIVVCVLISLLTKPPTYKQIYRSTYWTRNHKVDQEDLDRGAIEIEWIYFTLWFKLKFRTDQPVKGTYRKSQIFDSPSYASLNTQVSFAPGDVESDVKVNPGGVESDIKDVDDQYPVTFECSPQEGDEKKKEVTSGTEEKPELTDDEKRDLKAKEAEQPSDVQTTGTDLEDKKESGMVISVEGSEAEVEGEDKPQGKFGQVKEFCGDFFCGGGEELREPTEEELKRWKEEDEKASSLDQDPQKKALLHVLMVIVVSIGISMLIFWSVWEYTVDPLPETTSAPPPLDIYALL